ncbi:probable glutathione S-transferase [Fulvimarina pelagi HTCC2506]|uniref:Probable glutathione S-transferase n=1 Tax=Fulvimarina pelagi HTCC2506 TaxID=314231 RepID=Q0G100_9HYPH|nr:glutathione S-transferase N-terminal domain-containing protein [Fulvimarina pelagi]EAU40839.1 probable glutathione S-transferase [Fulvimarina pelagi HTCC2506]
MKLFKNATSPFARVAHAMLMEAGAHPEIDVVNQWESPDRLVDRNPAQRIPTLELDDGSILTEALIIARHAADIAPDGSHLKTMTVTDYEISGFAFGVFDSAVYTLNGRKIVSGEFGDSAFDGSEMGQRRRRSMVNGLQRLEGMTDKLSTSDIGLAEISTVTALHYVKLRFPDADWMPATPNLDAFAERVSERPSIGKTMPN